MALINRWTLGRTKTVEIDVTLTAEEVGAVALPDTPATYSTTAADLAAVLVAAGLMAAE